MYGTSITAPYYTHRTPQYSMAGCEFSTSGFSVLLEVRPYALPGAAILESCVLGTAPLSGGTMSLLQ